MSRFITKIHLHGMQMIVHPLCCVMFLERANDRCTGGICFVYFQSIKPCADLNITSFSPGIVSIEIILIKSASSYLYTLTLWCQAMSRCKPKWIFTWCDYKENLSLPFSHYDDGFVSLIWLTLMMFKTIHDLLPTQDVRSCTPWHRW